MTDRAVIRRRFLGGALAVGAGVALDADLVVLSDDPRRVPTADLPGVGVVMTMLGGRVEFCAADAGPICSGIG